MPWFLSPGDKKVKVQGQFNAHVDLQMKKSSFYYTDRSDVNILWFKYSCEVSLNVYKHDCL